MSSGPHSKLFKGLPGHFFLVNCLCAGLVTAFEETAGAPVNTAGTNRSFVIYSLIPPAPRSKRHGRTAWINPEALQLHILSFSH